MSILKAILTCIGLVGFGSLLTFGAIFWKRINPNISRDKTTTDRYADRLGSSETRCDEGERNLSDAAVRLESAEGHLDRAIELFDKYLEGSEMDRPKSQYSIKPWYSSVGAGNS